jgi:acetyltransferase-like isoleucine patch superfamily enzyme
MSNIHHSLRFRILHRWRRFWLALSGPHGFGRIASRFVAVGLPPYHQKAYLADLSTKGYISHNAFVTHPDLNLGSSVFIGDNVIVSKTGNGGPITLEDRVQIYGDSFLDTGDGASIHIGKNTHIQPGCHLHAYQTDIRIGRQVEIAARCGFYSYDHGMAPGQPIMEQALTSKGPIVIGDGAWLGFGVSVLSGVTIGEGAVIAAGAVVVRDIPANAIAGGVPARVIGSRIPADLPGHENITPITSSGTSRGQENIRKINS